MEGFITGQFLEVQCRHIKEYRLTPCCVLLCTNAYLFIYQGTVRCFFRAQIYRVHGFRPFYHGMIFMLQIPGFWRTTYVYFMWKMLSEMRKERNGDEYKEIRRASCFIEKPQNG